jgi:hypothetical protein
MSDLKRLVRAVRIIEKLGWKYEHKDVAEALMKHCSARERGSCAFVGHYLVDVFYLNQAAERAAEPRCRECGGDVYGAKDSVRADARYCSPMCRQRAYRKRRVTDAGGTGSHKRHETDETDTSDAHATHSRNTPTPGGAVAP